MIKKKLNMSIQRKEWKDRNKDKYMEGKQSIRLVITK
jgi:hypothetical protein